MNKNLGANLSKTRFWKQSGSDANPSSSSDAQQTHDLVRRSAESSRPRWETPAKPREMPVEEVQVLQDRMSQIFRNEGHIQLLSEENFTRDLVEKTLQHPSLKAEFVRLTDNVSQHFPEDLRSLAQTTACFKYATSYVEQRVNAMARQQGDGSSSQEKPVDDSSSKQKFYKRQLKDLFRKKQDLAEDQGKKKQTHDSKSGQGDINLPSSSSGAREQDTSPGIQEVMAQRALEAVNKRMSVLWERNKTTDPTILRELLKNELFTGAKDSARDRGTITKGVSAPLKQWETPEGKEAQEKVESKLKIGKFDEDTKKQWEKYSQESHIREYANCRDISLSYQGQPVQSVEIITHHSQDRTQTDVDKRVSRGTNYEGMKITTGGGTFYSSLIGGRRFGEAQLVPTEVMTTLKPFLSGSHYERDHTTAEKNQQASSYWQEKDVDWRILPNNRNTYYNEVHPLITQYSRSVVGEMQKNGKERISIVDIAGGNGDLAERLIKDLHRTFPDLQIDYKLVDYSEKDVAIARTRFETFQGNENIRAEAIHKDMEEYGYNADTMKKDLTLPSEGVDLVINSGGLLNNAISGNKETPEFYDHMFAGLMAKGGYGVYSGLTPLLVNSKSHDTAGLDVLNTHSYYSDKQMHVVQKPAR